jgi:hypothetical protein
MLKGPGFQKSARAGLLTRAMAAVLCGRAYRVALLKHYSAGVRHLRIRKSGGVVPFLTVKMIRVERIRLNLHQLPGLEGGPSPRSSG